MVNCSKNTRFLSKSKPYLVHGMPYLCNLLSAKFLVVVFHQFPRNLGLHKEFRCDINFSFLHLACLPQEVRGLVQDFWRDEIAGLRPEE